MQVKDINITIIPLKALDTFKLHYKFHLNYKNYSWSKRIYGNRYLSVIHQELLICNKIGYVIGDNFKHILKPVFVTI